MKLRILFPVLLASLLVAACGPLMRGMGKTCLGEFYTTELARLRARSPGVVGKTLSFCKGGAKPEVVKVTVPDTPIYDYVNLNLKVTYEANDKGEIRYDGSCKDMDRKKYFYQEVPVALHSSSFTSVKLCYFDATRTQIALVEPGEVCPQGSLAQPEPVDDCTRL